MIMPMLRQLKNAHIFQRLRNKKVLAAAAAAAAAEVAKRCWIGIGARQLGHLFFSHRYDIICVNRIVFAAEFYDFGFSARIFMFECQIANRTRLVGWLFFASHFVSSRDVFSCNHFNCTQIEMKRERTKPASKRNSISRSNTKTHCSKNRFHVRFFLHKCVVSCLEVWFRPSRALSRSQLVGVR